MADNPTADFTLTLRRGEGMALLAMDWRPGKPPDDFVGFAISYTPPGAKAKPVYNKLAFPDAGGKLDPKSQPTALAPIQLFRWVHFPPDAEVDGEFQYEVTPVHMAADGTLTHGVAQTESVVLGGDTFPDVLNIAFTRGYVSSQAFVNAFTPPDLVPALLPDQSSKGGPPADRLTFTPTHPKAAQAYTWMGFEARAAIEQVLDAAIADTAATVYVIAYDLDIAEIVDRLEQLGPRLHVIIDKSGEHRPADSPESTAAARLATTAGAGQVMRDTMDGLQHNKTIVVDSP